MNTPVLFVFLTFVAFTGLVESKGAVPEKKPPVIFVPGDGGNQLIARLNKPSTVHFLCEKTTNDFFTIWLNIELLVPIIIDCWVDNIKLVYDNKTRTTSNQPGVEIKVPGFGKSETVEWLDPLKIPAVGPYFKYIADALVDLGYERNVNIKGAPFDFRKGPNENVEYFKMLKKLVEDTYYENGNTSVILTVHSMGGPMSLYFLQQMTQEWKDTYINSLVSLSAAWAGSVKAMKVFSIGDDLGVFLLPEKVLKQMQITLTSLAWLMPSSEFWKEDEVLVVTQGKNYSLSNLKEFFLDTDYPIGYEMVVDQMAYRDFTPPGVEVHCLHGYGVDTLKRMEYAGSSFPEGDVTFVNEDGDGTVNQRSLQACTMWEGKQKQPVHHCTFANMDHMQILKDDRTLGYISDIIRGNVVCKDSY